MDAEQRSGVVADRRWVTIPCCRPTSGSQCSSWPRRQPLSRPSRSCSRHAAVPEPLIANNTTPPPPYDPATVRSVVRWGTLSGNLTEVEEQDHRLVYSYVYGPGGWCALCRGADSMRAQGASSRSRQAAVWLRPAARVPLCLHTPLAACAGLAPLPRAASGNTTYQSPILHHVLLRDLDPDTTYHYAVGGPAALRCAALCCAVPRCAVLRCACEWTTHKEMFLPPEPGTSAPSPPTDPPPPAAPTRRLPPGDEAHGFSEELSFRTLGGYPLRIGVIGDLGARAMGGAV